MSRYLVLYDADCGICTKFKRTLDFIDTYGRLEFMSIDRAEGLGLLDSLSDPVRHRSFHLVFPDNRVESGAVALPTLIRLLPAGVLISKMIISVPKGLSMLNFLYSTVSRLHDVGSCKRQPGVGGLLGDRNLGKRQEFTRTTALFQVG